MRRMVLGLAVAGLAMTGAANAGVGHQWGDLHWGQRGTAPTIPIRYAFSDRSADDWLPVYRTGERNAFAKWNDDPRSPLILVDRGPAREKDSAICDADAGEVLVCAHEYGTAEGWTGIAEIFISGSRISSGTAKMNDSFFAYQDAYDRPGRREFTMCHELGHTFGLAHLDEDFFNPNLGSCMDYTADVFGLPDNRDPGHVDWAVLTSSLMYGAPTVTSDRPSASDRFRVPDPSRERGTLVASGRYGASRAVPSERELQRSRFGGVLGYDAHGRPNSFVRDLRGGQKITFVMWADGYRPEGTRRDKALPATVREISDPAR
ncbi:hypothetical protein WJT74_08795 [Sphingomicrobium sp. XHP0239]|uniref:hypothetical protein n=1 Tax=Sphingomicrobium maritimum TaxID=3133972 RepID=UPI0031CC458F